MEPMAPSSRRLRASLRTSEAHGDGTDARLVLLEARTVNDCLRQLELLRVRVREDRLAALWEGLDLQEVTMRMREVQDLIDLLLDDAR